MNHFCWKRLVGTTGGNNQHWTFYRVRLWAVNSFYSWRDTDQLICGGKSVVQYNEHRIVGTRKRARKGLGFGTLRGHSHAGAIVSTDDAVYCFCTKMKNNNLFSIKHVQWGHFIVKLRISLVIIKTNPIQYDKCLLTCLLANPYTTNELYSSHHHYGILTRDTMSTDPDN